MIGALTGVMSSLKALKDTAETMVSLRDSATFQEKRVELQSKILDAQSSAFAAQEERTALVEQVRELEQQVARFKAWETEKQRYELKDVGLGCLAYTVKPDAQGADPTHSICATCYHDAQKSH